MATMYRTISNHAMSPSLC